MKRFLSILILFTVMFSLCAQQTESEKNVQKKNEYDVFTFAFAPGVSTSPDYVNTCGIRIGIPISHGKEAYVAGIDVAIIGAMTSQVYGLQTSFIYTSAEKGVDGMQFSIVNNAGTINGLQLGIVNVARDRSFQVGLINVIRESPLMVFPFVNVRF